MSNPHALIALSDPEKSKLLTEIIAQYGMDIALATTVGETRAVLSQRSIDVIFCQASLIDGTYCNVLRAAEGAKCKIPVVVCSRFYDRDLYIEAMSLGAFDFITFPCCHAEINWIVRHALGRVNASSLGANGHAA